MARFPDPDDSDPFASVPGGVPPSPFECGLGATPPWLAGRHQALQAAADQLRVLLDGRPAGPIGLHGPMAIGKTAILKRIASEVTARGGVVAWIDPLATLDAVEALRSARRQLAPDEATGATDSVREAHAVAVEAARTSARPLLVMVEDAHAATEVTRQLDVAHQGVSSDTPTSIVMTGAHSHATLRDMPEGIRSIQVGSLATDQAIEALTRPLERHGIELPDDILEDAAQRSQGIPLAVQAWGEGLWQASHHDASEVNTQHLQPAVDARVGRVHSTTWANLTDTDRNYIAAIATQTDEPVSSSGAAAKAGYDSAQKVSPVRAKLIDQGILHAPARGQIQVAIAGFGRWHHHHHTDTTPDAKTQRIHHEPAARPAAEPAPDHPRDKP